MSERSVRLLLDDMLEATERIERYVVGFTNPGSSPTRRPPTPS